jgi:WD40 repeat protein
MSPIVALAPRRAALALLAVVLAGLSAAAVRPHGTNRRAHELSWRLRLTLHDAEGFLTVALSADGGKLAATRRPSPNGDEMILAVWDIATGEQRWRLSTRANAFTAHFLPDGRLALVDEKGALSLYDVASGAKQSTPVLPLVCDDFAIAFSADGRLVAAVTGETGSLSVWDVATGAEVAVAGYDDEAYQAQDPAFSWSDRFVAATFSNGGIRFWDTRTGGLRKRIPGGLAHRSAEDIHERGWVARRGGPGGPGPGRVDPGGRRPGA